MFNKQIFFSETFTLYYKINVTPTHTHRNEMQYFQMLKKVVDVVKGIAEMHWK
jgi:hypothetical protein